MNPRTLAMLLALAAIGWWFSPLSPRGPSEAQAYAAQSAGCQMPPRVAPFEEPLQSPVPEHLQPVRLPTATLTALAGFSVDAKVLSRHDYGSDRPSELSPVDLALGWGPMRDDAVIQRLDITQSGRWYRWRYQGEPPIPPRDIVRSSANMHMIPADKRVADALESVEQGDRVRIDGWLVEARGTDGWRWRSSTSRTDTGGGACEVIYVCAVTQL
jgi:hypothetical protein